MPLAPGPFDRRAPCSSGLPILVLGAGRASPSLEVALDPGLPTTLSGPLLAFCRLDSLRVATGAHHRRMLRGCWNVKYKPNQTKRKGTNKPPSTKQVSTWLSPSTKAVLPADRNRVVWEPSALCGLGTKSIGFLKAQGPWMSCDIRSYFGPGTPS